MPESKVISLEERAKDEQKPFLERLLQEGARKLLQAAIENEVIDYIQFHKDRVDENGQRMVVRNGHLPEREVISGAGPIPVRQPRVRHRDKGRFSSAILPKYMRRVPSVDALIPALYLKGISTGDFSEALSAILGEGASGLSATNSSQRVLSAGTPMGASASMAFRPSEVRTCSSRKCSARSRFGLDRLISAANTPTNGR